MYKDAHLSIKTKTSYAFSTCKPQAHCIFHCHQAQHFIGYNPLKKSQPNQFNFTSNAAIFNFLKHHQLHACHEAC